MANQNDKIYLSHVSQWVAGYISSANLSQRGPDIGREIAPDHDTIMLFLQQHCVLNPLDKLVTPVQRLVTKLRGTVTEAEKR